GTDDDLQTSIVITDVTPDFFHTVVSGTLQGVANSAVALDFFATSDSGERYLGSAVESTGPDGILPFSAEVAAISAAEVVTARTAHVDGGANNELQNFPILTNVERGVSTRVAGALHSARSASYTLDFYANSAGDPSGFGEGERYLGSTAVATGADGSVA